MLDFVAMSSREWQYDLIPLRVALIITSRRSVEYLP